MGSGQPVQFSYTIAFSDGREKRFEVRLHDRTCAVLQAPREDYPKWTSLAYKKCRDCPLAEEDHPRCPVAVSIVDLVEFFCQNSSVERVEVRFESRQRSFIRADVPISRVISSLLGIHMVTSGCPVLDPLRPMARFHLPFADIEETTYRAISMHLLGQYFEQKRGRPADWSLEGLRRIYCDISRVNEDFAKRLAFGVPNEAAANALADLDCFAQWIDLSISDQTLDDLEALFEAVRRDA